jgi:hypothetical protein
MTSVFGFHLEIMSKLGVLQNVSMACLSTSSSPLKANLSLIDEWGTTQLSNKMAFCNILAAYSLKEAIEIA